MHSHSVCNTTLAAGVAATLLLAGCTPQSEDTSTEINSIADAIATDADGSALGSVRFPTSCTADAQPLLERGLALLHHMNYIKARNTFLQATDIDAECAIAYWGAAMTHVHPLWPDTILPEAQVSGQELLNKAADAKHTSDRELAYINALQGYYRENNRSEIERLRAFEDGWAVAHESNPQDLEASLFYALALTSTAAPSDKTYANQKMAGAIAENVKAEIPQHPGAHHYIIHAYDNPVLAENALETARHYDEVAPENTHALHMTSHIFTRRGLWSESIIYNRRVHHMNYIKARNTFLQATDIDAECAIAYWGAAMTHVHPLWPDTILPEAQVSGQELLNKAADAKHTSDRELALPPDNRRAPCTDAASAIPPWPQELRQLSYLPAVRRKVKNPPLKSVQSLMQ